QTVLASGSWYHLSRRDRRSLRSVWPLWQQERLVGRLDALCAVRRYPELVYSESPDSWTRCLGDDYRTCTGCGAGAGNLPARGCLEQRSLIDVVCPNHDFCPWHNRTSELFGLYGARRRTAPRRGCAGSCRSQVPGLVSQVRKLRLRRPDSCLRLAPFGYDIRMNKDTLKHLALLATRQDLLAWEEVADLIRRAGDYRWVGLHVVTRSEIWAVAWTGALAPALPRFLCDKGLNGVAVTTKKPVVCQDVANDPRYQTAFAGTGSGAIFPVVSQVGEVIGTIDVESDHRNAFSADDEQFLRGCAAT